VVVAGSDIIKSGVSSDPKRDCRCDHQTRGAIAYDSVRDMSTSSKGWGVSALVESS